jgi:adenosine kinase
MFEASHIESPQVAPLVEAARFFYVEGYFLTHGAGIVTNIAKHASDSGKVGFVVHLFIMPQC